MAELSINERIKRIVDYSGKTINHLSKELDVSQPALRSAVRGETYPGFDMLSKIIKNFPEVGIDWIMTGEGAMLKSDNPIATIETQNLDEGTPLLPVEAWGGSLNGSSIAVLAEQCKKYNVPINNIDYLIPIAGDSMMPDYCPGDIVGIKKINERAFIEWGKVYVLDTCNGVVIKEVQPSENDGCITCISHNMPERYRPFEVSLNPEDFYGMYAVKGTVRIS